MTPPTISLVPSGDGWRWVLDTPAGPLEGEQVYSTEYRAQAAAARQVRALNTSRPSPFDPSLLD